MTDGRLLHVDGHDVRLSNPDKVLWPATGFTKADLAAYHLAVAPVALPHLRGRALTLLRCPDGVEAGGWFQVSCQRCPSWMPTCTLPTARGDGTVFRHCVADHAAALVWLANHAAVELHPFLARCEAPDEPTALVFDLDPRPPAGLVAACQVALWLRARLGADRLRAVVKTSGRAGVHVVVPLGPGHRFEVTKAAARAIADDLAADHPAEVTTRMPLAERAGKVLVDWSQNDRTKSLVAPYSLRATPVPWVSAPVTWDEVADAVSHRDARRLRLLPRQVLDRVERLGDLFAPRGDAWGQRLGARPAAG